MRRPHIQEHATNELANLIDHLLKPKGLMVHITASHFCMCWRGVEEHAFKMTTVAKKGLFNQLEHEKRFYQLLEIRQNKE
jgi:GTP cyclohydrolase I